MIILIIHTVAKLINKYLRMEGARIGIKFASHWGDHAKLVCHNKGVRLFLIDGYKLVYVVLLEDWVRLSTLQAVPQIESWVMCPFQCVLYHGIL
jgi:hypothetical protein